MRQLGVGRGEACELGSLRRSLQQSRPHLADRRGLRGEDSGARTAARSCVVVGENVGRWSSKRSLMSGDELELGSEGRAFAGCV